MRAQLNFVRVFVVLMVAMFLAPSLSAGFIDDAKFYIKNRTEIKQHSKNVTVAVRELYRDRKSVSQFAQSAGVLVQAYKGINRAMPNVSQLMNIAKSIDTLVREYNYLAPKCDKLYNQVKPDLQYFSAFKDDVESVDNAKPGILKKTITDSRISKLAGGAGWSRVWDSVKENPLNVFRWGKLRDEYNYGKTEAHYVLKTAQIAYEAASYYQAAKDSMSELLDIRTQINKLLSGDLTAILGMGDTINKVTNGATAVNHLGVVIEEGVSHMGKRFDELNKYQASYLETHVAYQQKYAPSVAAKSPVTSTPPTVPNSSVKDPNQATRNASGQVVQSAGLQKAQEVYQQAYREYTRTMSDSSIDIEDRNQAIENLRKARQLLDQAKTAAQ